MQNPGDKGDSNGLRDWDEGDGEHEDEGEDEDEDEDERRKV